VTVSMAVQVIPSRPTVPETISRLGREQIESFIEIAIALIDSMDGDENVEDDGGSEPDDFGEDDDPLEDDDPCDL
jgi:hypothetical protein